MTTSIPRPDGIDRTSKRIQTYIRQLEAEVSVQQRTIASLSSGGADDNANVQASGQRIEDPNFPLWDDAQVMFFMGDGRRRIDDCIIVRHDRQDRTRTRLRVESTQSLYIEPSASNSFHIVFRDH